MYTTPPRIAAGHAPPNAPFRFKLDGSPADDMILRRGRCDGIGRSLEQAFETCLNLESEKNAGTYVPMREEQTEENPMLDHEKFGRLLKVLREVDVINMQAKPHAYKIFAQAMIEGGIVPAGQAAQQVVFNKDREGEQVYCTVVANIHIIMFWPSKAGITNPAYIGNLAGFAAMVPDTRLDVPELTPEQYQEYYTKVLRHVYDSGDAIKMTIKTYYNLFYIATVRLLDKQFDNIGTWEVLGSILGSVNNMFKFLLYVAISKNTHTHCYIPQKIGSMLMEVQVHLRDMLTRRHPGCKFYDEFNETFPGFRIVQSIDSIYTYSAGRAHMFGVCGCRYPWPEDHKE